MENGSDQEDFQSLPDFEDYEEVVLAFVVRKAKDTNSWQLRCDVQMNSSLSVREAFDVKIDRYFWSMIRFNYNSICCKTKRTPEELKNCFENLDRQGRLNSIYSDTEDLIRRIGNRISDQADFQDVMQMLNECRHLEIDTSSHLPRIEVDNLDDIIDCMKDNFLPKDWRSDFKKENEQDIGQIHMYPPIFDSIYLVTKEIIAASENEFKETSMNLYEYRNLKIACENEDISENAYYFLKNSLVKRFNHATVIQSPLCMLHDLGKRFEDLLREENYSICRFNACKFVIIIPGESQTFVFLLNLRNNNKCYRMLQLQSFLSKLFLARKICSVRIIPVSISASALNSQSVKIGSKEMNGDKFCQFLMGFQKTIHESENNKLCKVSKEKPITTGFFQKSNYIEIVSTFLALYYFGYGLRHSYSVNSTHRIYFRGEKYFFDNRLLNNSDMLTNLILCRQSYLYKMVRLRKERWGSKRPKRSSDSSKFTYRRSSWKDGEFVKDFFEILTKEQGEILDIPVTKNHRVFSAGPRESGQDRLMVLKVLQHIRHMSSFQSFEQLCSGLVIVASTSQLNQFFIPQITKRKLCSSELIEFWNEDDLNIKLTKYNDRESRQEINEEMSGTCVFIYEILGVHKADCSTYRLLTMLKHADETLFGIWSFQTVLDNQCSDSERLAETFREFRLVRSMTPLRSIPDVSSVGRLYELDTPGINYGPRIGLYCPKNPLVKMLKAEYNYYKTTFNFRDDEILVATDIDNDDVHSQEIKIINCYNQNYCTRKEFKAIIFVSWVYSYAEASIKFLLAINPAAPLLSIIADAEAWKKLPLKYCYVLTNADFQCHSIDLSQFIRSFEDDEAGGDNGKVMIYKRNCNTWRGYCLIINNQHFSQKSDLEERKGSHTDCHNLKLLFKLLGYEIAVFQDLNAKQISDQVRKFTNLIGHGYADSTFIILLSHGIKDHIFGEDGSLVNIYDLNTLLDCQKLAGKPKIMLVQACRKESISWWDKCIHSIGKILQKYRTSAKSPSRNRIPRDHLIAYATSAGKEAYRNEYLGSWYFQAIFEVFKCYATEQDILELLNEVNVEVAKKSSDIEQVPEYDSNLTMGMLL